MAAGTFDPTTTAPGDCLAWKLNPALGTTLAIRRTCATLVALARRYDRIQERWCNEDMSDGTRAALERTEARLEDRIRDTVGRLPHTDHGPIGAAFDGDPRGSTVKLVMPPELHHLHDDWGRSGVCVLE